MIHILFIDAIIEVRDLQINLLSVKGAVSG